MIASVVGLVEYCVSQTLASGLGFAVGTTVGYAYRYFEEKWAKDEN